MARLQRVERDYDSAGQQVGLIVFYRTDGGVDTTLHLSNAEIDGLTPAQIKTLAQARADAANLVAADSERTDIIANPRREARQWFAANPAVRAFFEQTPDEIDADIDAATTAQLKAVVKGCAIIARVYGLLEIAD